MDFLSWLESTWVAVVVGQTMYGYPLLETVHAVGMAMLIGAIGLLNARVLGYKPELPILGVHSLMPLAWIGFTLNLLSGTALFISDANYFFASYTFRVKMLLVVLAGINAWLLGRGYFGEVLAGAEPVPSTAVKCLAVSSLFFWFGALIAGRLLAYTP